MGKPTGFRLVYMLCHGKPKGHLWTGVGWKGCWEVSVGFCTALVVAVKGGSGVWVGWGVPWESEKNSRACCKLISHKRKAHIFHFPTICEGSKCLDEFIFETEINSRKAPI